MKKVPPIIWLVMVTVIALAFVATYMLDKRDSNKELVSDSYCPPYEAKTFEIEFLD